MLDAITRRGVLVRALALAAGLAVGMPGRAAFAAPKRLPVYVLDPLGEDGCARCGSCRACRRHAENKLFASKSAAEGHRAHPNCDCAVRRAGDLPAPIWFALFAPTRAIPGKEDTVDRRHAGVADLLAPFAVNLA